MNDLNTLLERAAGPAAPPLDPYADLTRGHRALARTRRRRGAAGLAGVATLGVVGIGLGRVLVNGPETASGGHAPGIASDPTSTPPAPAPWAPPGPDLAAGPYTFPAIPDGWEVQGHHPQEVTIAPVGFADQEPLSFLGKLVINYDQNDPSGHQVQRDGRTFFVDTQGDTATIAVATRAGEPQGEVTIQYPTSAGWSEDDMVAFLGGIQVGASALPGLG